MAKKPVHGLPDVFAKPGGAPARGTPIEDLPTDEANPDAHTPMAADSAAAPPAGTAGAATLPSVLRRLARELPRPGQFLPDYPPPRINRADAPVLDAPALAECMASSGVS